jgi:hypothetical protein
LHPEVRPMKVWFICINWPYHCDIAQL